MVRVVREYRPGAIELLGQYHAREGMRQRHAGKAQLQPGVAPETLVQSVRPADRECNTFAAVAPAPELLGELLRSPVPATLIERHQLRTRRNGGAQPLALGAAAALGVVCTARSGLGLQFPELHLEVRRKADQIIVNGGIDPRRLLLPDRQDQDLHRAGETEGPNASAS